MRPSFLTVLSRLQQEKWACKQTIQILNNQRP
jgi:hypothetical protein